MALLSQGGGAYTVPSGTLCSKTRAKAVSGGVDVLSMKDSFYSRSKRGNHQLIVAASPPTDEAAVVAAEPLTREDLIAYLASGCKSKDKWRYFFVCYDVYCCYPQIVLSISLTLQNRYRT